MNAELEALTVEEFAPKFGFGDEANVKKIGG